jgi:hypothetical protein
VRAVKCEANQAIGREVFRLRPLVARVLTFCGLWVSINFGNGFHVVAHGQTLSACTGECERLRSSLLPRSSPLSPALDLAFLSYAVAPLMQQQAASLFRCLPAHPFSV